MYYSKPVSPAEYAAMTHRLPASPTALDYAAFYPLAFGTYCARMAAAFGWRPVVFMYAA
jgi:hypothetical protein